MGKKNSTNDDLYEKKDHNVLKKTQFIHEFLTFQHATAKEDMDKQAKVKFIRDRSLDGEHHNYTATRTLDPIKKRWVFELHQDGEPVDFPGARMDNLDLIIDQIEQYYKMAKLTLGNHRNIESNLSELKDKEKTWAMNLEKMAGWIEAFLRLSLITNQDLEKIANIVLPDIGLSHFIDRTLKDEEDNQVLKCYSKETIEPVYPHKQAKTYFTQKLITNQDSNIDFLNASTKHITQIIRDLLIPRLKRRDFEPSPFVNENGFMYNLKKMRDQLDSQLPQKFYTISSIQNETLAEYNSQNKDLLTVLNTMINQFTSIPQDSAKLGIQSNYFPFIQEAKPVTQVKRPPNIFIEAPIGMGKTTLLTRLFIERTDLYLANPTYPLPIMLTAARIRGGEFPELIDTRFQENVPFLDAVRRSCESKARKMILFVDGLDECPEHLFRPLLEYLGQCVFDNILFVISSRPSPPIKVAIKMKIHNLVLLSLKYENQIDYSRILPDFPSIMLKNELLSNLLFQKSYLIRELNSPILFNILTASLEEIASQNRAILASKLPLPIYNVFQIYYEALMHHAKEKGFLSSQTTIQDVLRAGKELAHHVLTRQPTVLVEKEFALLRIIGLVVGTSEDPRFVHALYLRDFLVRVISTGEPELSAAQLFEIVCRDAKEKTDICMDAIALITKAGPDVIDIHDPHLDLFEHLYDNPTLYFSRLKTMVWAARGKGETPLVIYGEQNINTDPQLYGYDYKSDTKRFVENLKRNWSEDYPPLNDIQNYAAIFHGDLPPTERVDDFHFLPLFWGLNKADQPIPAWQKFLKTPFFQTKFGAFEVFVLLDFLFQGRTAPIFQQLYEVCINAPAQPTNEDETYTRVKCGDLLKQYVRLITWYPPALPNLEEMPEAQAICHKILGQIPRQQKNLPLNLNIWSHRGILTLLNSLLPINQCSQSWDEFDRICAALIYDHETLPDYCQDNAHFLGHLFTFVETSLQSLPISALSDSETKSRLQGISALFGAIMLLWQKPEVLVEVIAAVQTPEILALFLNVIAAENDARDEHEPSNITALRLSLIREASFKLKRMLRERSDGSLEEYLFNHCFNSELLPRDFKERLIVILEPRDLTAFPALENQSIEERYFDKALKNEVIKRFLNTFPHQNGNIDDYFSDFPQILQIHTHSPPKMFLKILWLHAARFRPLIDELKESTDIFDEINKIINNRGLSRLFLQAFWDSAFDELRASQDPNNDWDLTWFLQDLKISLPIEKKQEILADDNLIRLLMPHIKGSSHFHQSVKDLFQAILSTKTEIAVSYFREQLADYISKHNIYPMTLLDYSKECYLALLEEMMEHSKKHNFGLLEERMHTSRPCYNNLFQEILPNVIQSANPDSFLRVMKLITPTEMHMLNITYLSQADQDQFMKLLRRHASEPDLHPFLSIYVPEIPIQYINDIHSDQQSNLEWLQSHGIDIEDRFD